MWTYNPKTDIEFKKGQLFTNVDAFRTVLKDYAIQKVFRIVRVKNENSRVTTIYGVEGCKWRILASSVADSITFMIKSYQEKHTCVMDRKNIEVTADWIAKKQVPVLIIHPNMSTKRVEAEMIKYDNVPLTFMSDRQKGLNLAYEEIVSVASERHYCSNICSNFKAQFPGILLSNLFWRAAKNYDSAGHNEAIATINELNKEVWRYLEKIPKTSWCRYTFAIGIKCDHVTNNCTESFNAWVGELRGKPILTLVEGLRKKFMKKMHKRYQKGCTLTTSVTPKMVDKLPKIGQTPRQCQLTMTSEDIFEVRDMNRSNMVNLLAKNCDCRAFQILGLPRKHAALGIIYKRQKLESYYNHWFSRDMYLKTCASMIHPIPDEKMWPPMPNVNPSTVLSPLLRRAPGRLKVHRRREHDEGHFAPQPKRLSRFKCENCGSFDHNKRSCQRALVQKKKGSKTPSQQDYVQGNVPGVNSSQESNPSPTSQPGTENVELPVPTKAIASKQRGRPLYNTGATTKGSSKRTCSNATTRVTQTLEPPPIQQIAASQAATATSFSISAATTLQSGNVNSSNSVNYIFLN
ncbi:uncharacterized protein LOC113759457 [Coffea eugenioides]|uniref:uncharacterized protein LOC113759455 n=1 Tax=Coffea eugenioides TaxID=49369 RepID=UPI000F60A08E|nr:uncharacterized protein LOC113759455 [Coffea eugenioides]XP_027157837.1 uncharacterized protein LOC113759457 [Coffea eugenioides]